MPFHTPLYERKEIIGSDAFARLQRHMLHNELMLGAIHDALAFAPEASEDVDHLGVYLIGIYIKRTDAPSDDDQPYAAGGEADDTFVGAVLLAQTQATPLRMAVFISHPDPDAPVQIEEYCDAIVHVVTDITEDYSFDEVQSFAGSEPAVHRVRLILKARGTHAIGTTMWMEWMQTYSTDVPITQRRNLVTVEIDEEPHLIRITYPTNKIHHSLMMKYYHRSIREALEGVTYVGLPELLYKYDIASFITTSKCGEIALVTTERTDKVVAVLTINNRLPHIARISSIHTRENWRCTGVATKCMPHIMNHIAAARAGDGATSFPVSLVSSKHLWITDELRDMGFRKTSDETALIHIEDRPPPRQV